MLNIEDPRTGLGITTHELALLYHVTHTCMHTLLAYHVSVFWSSFGPLLHVASSALPWVRNDVPFLRSSAPPTCACSASLVPAWIWAIYTTSCITFQREVYSLWPLVIWLLFGLECGLTVWPVVCAWYILTYDVCPPGCILGSRIDIFSTEVRIRFVYFV